MTANDLLEQLQPLSDTPLRPLPAPVGRLTALGGIDGGPAALKPRLAALGAELVEDAPHGTMHRLDNLGVVVSCTSFGGLMLMQVPDVDRFVDGCLRGSLRDPA